MDYGIMRVEERTQSAVYGLQIEANRTALDYAQGREFTRSDIDWSRTSDNVQLVHTDNWNTSITEQLSIARIKERKNSVVLLDGLYTASPAWFSVHTYKQVVEYFKNALDFHVLEYCGGDRSLLLNAVIHFDESTPHLHVASIPIVKDNDESHLSAKKSWET